MRLRGLMSQKRMTSRISPLCARTRCACPSACLRAAPVTAWYLSLGPGSVCCACAQRHGLPRASHSGELACLALQAVLSAHVAFAPRVRMRQSFSRTLTSQKHNIFSMVPKLRCPMVLLLLLQGVCDDSSGKCSCQYGWTGSACQRLSCATSSTTNTIPCNNAGTYVRQFAGRLSLLYLL
jgi:hypothetical protein